MAQAIDFRDENMDAPVPVISVRSIKLAADNRGEDRQLRVSAPVTGRELPVILFSHGFGSSMDGYAPLVDYWAAHGFVVIQPTYLDSHRTGLSQHDPRRPDIWRIRVADAKTTIDQLDTVVGQVPGLRGRVAPHLLAAAGHSFGGQTTSLLLGARMADDEDMADPRVTAGVLLASGGRGGNDLSELGRKMTPYLNMSFDRMTCPTLVVAGDADRSPLTARGPDWFHDPYLLAPGGEALLTLASGEHMLGGISGYAAAETTDENPARVRLVQKVTAAYLVHKMKASDEKWNAVKSALASGMTSDATLSVNQFGFGDG